MGKVSLEHNAKWFFWSELRGSELDLTDAAMAYVVHLLDEFITSEAAYQGVEPGPPIFFEFIERAAQASPAQQVSLYRHVGDLALFLLGLAPGSLPASRSYYVGVGGGAYCSVAARVPPAAGPVF